MIDCQTASIFSNLFSTLSLVSWICAQGPQIYINYKNKTTEGIAPSFLILWFMGDFLSFTSCLLNNVVLDFQIYLSLFFLANDITLCFQYYYYNSVYPRKFGKALYTSQINNNETTYELLTIALGSDTYNIAKPIGINRNYDGQFDEQETMSLSSDGSVKSNYSATLNSSFKTASTVVASAMNLTTANALPLNIQSEEPYSLSIMISAETFGLVLAWSCTFVYMSSRCPQLYKNYKRKSVEGISPILFGSALLGNLTYTLSILTSCNFLFGDSKLTFIWKELPYILGSSGTILFDIAYFYQRYIYRDSGKNTLVMSMENWEASSTSLQE